MMHNPPAPVAVSAGAPVSRAFERTSRFLFARFDLRVWCAAGLAAFLQQCSRGMGSNASFRGINLPGGGGRGGAAGMEEFVAKAQAFVDQWLLLLVLGVVLLMLLGLGLKLLLDWLGSRADFVLLDMLACGHSAFERAWNDYGPQGNSLFRLRAILAVASFVVTGFLLALLAMPALDDLEQGALSRRTIVAAVVLGAVGTLAFVALGVVAFFVNNVVMPIMYARRCDARRGWNDATALLRANFGSFFLFWLVRVGMVVVGGIAVGLVGCLSQCLCVGCIPGLGQYIVIVATMPVWATMQAYSGYFVEQFGPEYAMMDRWPDEGTELLPPMPDSGPFEGPSAPLPPGFGDAPPPRNP